MTAKKSIKTVLTVLTLVVAACGTADGESTTTAEGVGVENPDELTVVASTTLLGDVIGEIVGNDAAVEVLLPIGADPHDFQPSSQQVSLVGTADLVVVNGLGLEEGLHDVLESAESDGANVFEIAPQLDPIPFGASTHHDHDEDEDHEDEAEACDLEMAHEHEDEGDHEHEDEGDHEHEDEGNLEHEDEGDHEHEDGSCDPHIWMDPLKMANAARLIAAELGEVAPDGQWSDRAETYAAELIDANTQIEDMLSGIPEGARVLVTNHEAFGYFAALYDFEVVGTVVPGGSTLGDPSSSELADLVDVILEENVPAIFTDSSASSALAESIAEEVGEEVAIVELYSGSLGESGSGADTLIGLLTTNAERIAESLS